MMRGRWAIGMCALGLSAAATAAEWRMERAGSELRFEASYQGQAAPGTFKEFDTRLRFDPARPADGQLRVVVKLASADMGNADVNEAIREPDWFDLKRHPEAEFRSTAIAPNGPGRFLAHGRLRLKGAEREVSVPFVWEGAGKTATMKGELMLDRAAFNIGTGEWSSGNLIGLDVKVMFNVRLHRVDG